MGDRMAEQEAIEELKYDCEQLGKSVPCDTNWGQAINTAYGMAVDNKGEGGGSKWTRKGAQK